MFMEIDAPDPELMSPQPAPKPAVGACPTCGGGSGCGAGAIAVQTAKSLAMLDELAEIGMVVVRAMARPVRETGQVGAAEAAMIEAASRSVRRTVAMIHKIHEESRKSPEQRHAEALRRIDAQMRAQFRVRKAAIVRAMEDEIRAHVAARGGDAERLLGDMRERLFDADIARASTQQDVDAICLTICKGLGITPRNDTWSDALMALETHRMLAEVREADAARQARTAVADTPVAAPKEPSVDPKAGPLTLDENGAIASQDPAAFDPPQSEWAPDILNRPPIDLLKGRMLSDTG